MSLVALAALHAAALGVFQLVAGDLPAPSLANDAADDAPNLRSVELSEVWASVDAHYPELDVAELKVAAARGKEMSAMGAFDLYAKGAVGGDPLGKFSKRTGRVELEQALPWSGIQLFGGVRTGLDFPVYDGDQVTSENGEVRLGANFRVLRDRSIDETRLALRSSRLLTDAALRALDVKRLDVRLSAAQTYLKWVSAGLKDQVAQRLLGIAQSRQVGIQQQVKGGALAKIDALENELLIFNRQERVVSAQQALAVAALDLSLYLRTQQGTPVVPPPERVSDRMQDVIVIDKDIPLDQALAQRPDLKALQVDIERANIEVLGARNQLLPNLDVKAAGSRDFGSPRPYAPFARTTNETQVGIAVTLSLPVQMRKARGELAQRHAELEALQTLAAFLRDRVAVQIQQARTVMEATERRKALSEQSAAAARQLEAAERMRLDAGQSSLLVVNLRELASADAQARVIDAWAEHQVALVTYQAALGKL